MLSHVMNMVVCLLLVMNMDAAPALPPSPEKRPPDKPVRISLAEAERLVRNKVLAETPDMAADAKFPLRELTTDEVWNALDAQVLQVTAGVRACETFVVKKGEVTHIGIGFGGSGVKSLCVADLDNDGKRELVYGFSWGSGIHRSEIGVLTFGKAGAKEYVAPFAYRHPDGVGDLSVKSVEKQVLVFDDRQRLGHVVLSKKGESWAATVVLDEDLPKEFRERVWEYHKKPAESEKP